MEFGHHPDPAIDFGLEVDAIENDLIDRAAGMPPQIDNIGRRIERAMLFRVGGDQRAIAAKEDLRMIEAAFKAGVEGQCAAQSGRQFAQLFINTIHGVENRCMAADGPVTPTCKEITDDELRMLYQAAQSEAGVGDGR